MSILYISIVNQNNKTIIGSYNPKEINNSSLKEQMEKKINELINKLKVENGPEKNIVNFQTLSDKKIDIYYSLLNKGILYIVFVEILSIYLEHFKEESIYELIEEIDTQGIKLNVDSSGKLTNAGKQNLKFTVEKYQDSFFSKNELISNPSLIEEAPPDNKIAVINEQIRGVSNDMKNNVKNMINNINDINEIENKSVAIKDSSFKFRKDSLALEKKMKKNVWRNRIILIVVVVIILILIIYYMTK
jgi:hypothetical protein